MFTGACATDGIAHGQLFGVFRSPLIQRDNGFSPVNILYQIVDRFCVIALITYECALFYRQDSVGRVEDILHNSGIHDIGRSGQFIERQAEYNPEFQQKAADLKLLLNYRGPDEFKAYIENYSLAMQELYNSNPW